MSIVPLRFNRLLAWWTPGFDPDLCAKGWFGQVVNEICGLIGALALLGLSANEPSALLVVLVVLRSGRNRGVAFVYGWVTALVLVAAGAGFVIRLGLGPRRGGPRRVTLAIELVIGVALVGWSVRYWLDGRGRVKSVVGACQVTVVGTGAPPDFARRRWRAKVRR